MQKYKIILYIENLYELILKKHTLTLDAPL